VLPGLLPDKRSRRDSFARGTDVCKPAPLSVGASMRLIGDAIHCGSGFRLPRVACRNEQEHLTQG